MTAVPQAGRSGLPAAGFASRLNGLTLPGLVLLLANGWALQYIFAKILGDHGVPPFGSLLAVHLLMVMVFTAILLWKRKLFIPTLGRITFFVYAAGLGNVASLGAELAAAPHVPAGLLAIIVSMAPVFTVLFTVILRTEKVTYRSITGLVLGSTATLLILWPHMDYGSDGLGWVLLAFVAPASFGAMAVIMWACWPRGLDAVQVAFGNAIAGLLIVAPLAIVEDGTFHLTGEHRLAGVALLGFSLTLIAEYWLFAVITRKGGAVFASCADFGAIALGLLWAYLFFGEVPTAWMVAAAVLAMLSLGVVKRAGDH
jgi:drug/metabolite transporter (DMT)-like permease